VLPVGCHAVQLNSDRLAGAPIISDAIVLLRLGETVKETIVPAASRNSDVPESLVAAAPSSRPSVDRPRLTLNKACCAHALTAKLLNTIQPSQWSCLADDASAASGHAINSAEVAAVAVAEQVIRRATRPCR